MSTSPAFSKEQIKRLGVFTKGTPQTLEGMRELESAISSGDSEDQARAVITDWIHEHSEWPTPAAIYGALNVIRERGRANTESELPPWRRPIQCGACGDSGWRPVRRGQNEGVERCDHKVTA